MTESSPQKSRNGIEIGAAIVLGIFLVTLAFNAGVQYSQINSLNLRTDSNTVAITAATEKINANESTNGAMLSHIQTMVEDMRATQELKATGAMR